MSLITSLLDGLAMLTEPYWLTLHALGLMIGEAGAGTALFGGFLFVLALDFLRGSKGIFVPVSRVLAVVSTLFFLASFVYGDFLAAPAKAAYSAIVARSTHVPPNVVVLTTLGAAGAGAFFMTSRRVAPRALMRAAPSHTIVQAARRESVADIGRGLSLDTAGRLQLRHMSRNQKKTVNAVRPAMRAMAAVAPIPRHGQRARFGRV